MFWIVSASGLLTAAAVIAAACGSGAAPNPLATLDAIPPGGGEAILEARIDGVLVISDACVSLVTGEDTGWTVVWTESRASFDTGTGVITFINPLPDGSVVEMRDGDVVIFGGANFLDGREPYEYVRRPDESCRAISWHAQTVRLPSEE